MRKFIFDFKLRHLFETHKEFAGGILQDIGRRLSYQEDEREEGRELKREEKIITLHHSSQQLYWAALWVYDISASFIAGFDMISLICRDLLPLHTDSPHTLGWPPPGIEFLLNNSFIH